jgi:hypothetical protein
MKIIIVLCLLGATWCFDLWSSVFIRSRWMCLCGVSMCIVMLWHDYMAHLGRSSREVLQDHTVVFLVLFMLIHTLQTHRVRSYSVCVCDCILCQGYSILKHCKSSLSNINNNCSLSHRRLIILQDLNHPRLKFMAMMFYHLMVVRWYSQLYQVILIYGVD